MHNHKHIKIYRSRTHLWVTLIIVAVPFVFLLFFTRLTHIASSILLIDVAVSAARIIIAYVCAVIIAWLCAVLFYKGRVADVALPIFDVLQSFPTFAILPLATYIWGPSNYTLVFFLIITVIWPIFFSIISSLKLIRRDWYEAVTISGLSGFSYVKNFLLPATLPGLITGSIIGLGEGWEAIVATEIIVNTPLGLGSFFKSYVNNTWITALGVLGLLLLIFSINKLIWLPLLEYSHRTLEE